MGVNKSISDKVEEYIFKSNDTVTALIKKQLP